MSDTTAQWEKVQIKTFTKWVNMHLGKRGRKINDITTDFKSGVELCALLEIIGETTIKCVTNPKMRIQMTENLDKALRFIQSRDVKLTGIGPTDIVDGNVKLTLGLVWTLILRFAISELSAEGLSAKQGLLLWCQKKCEPYPLKVENFSESFKDGRVFCALIHRHRPDILDWETVGNDDRENLEKAFDVAEKELDIPKLLDVEDIVSMPRPDERSVMTYVAALYKVFSSNDQVEKAGKRAGNFLDLMRATQEMVHDYEQRAEALKTDIEAAIEKINAVVPSDTYAQIKEQINDTKEYRRGSKRAFIKEQGDLTTLFGQINSKLRGMKRPVYVAPEGLDPKSLEGYVVAVGEAEKTLRSQLNVAMRNCLTALRKAFAEPANEFDAKLAEFRNVVMDESNESSLEQQVEMLRGKFEEFKQIENQLPIIEQAENEMEAANIEDNEYSDHSYDDLKFGFDQVYSMYEKKIIFIEAQINEASSGVTAEQMQEFKQSFDAFDENKNGTLSKLEFRSCLSSLGLIDIDFTGGENAQFDAIFNNVRKGKPEIEFDDYVTYMKEKNDENPSPEQLNETFSTIAGGKDFVTENDMTKAGMSQEQIEYVKSTLPPKGDGYDYSSWINSV
ncbi:Alpha-actinin [Entamoeba marina]